MSRETIAVIPGDGIGKEVTPAARRVLESIGDFRFVEGEAGDEYADEYGEPLPDSTRQMVVDADATLFGAAGETAADVIIPLRNAVDAFVNVRPARAYPGVDALRPETDLVILRENTEGVYSGIESRLTDDVSTLTRVVTKSASRRLAKYACEYVEDNGYEKLDVAHKANVMRVTDGLFLESVEDVAADYGVETNPLLMDAMTMHLALRPEEFGVIVAPNLAGDVLSDLAAGLVGGLGLLPSANIGPDNAIFEPVHGSAPDIAGEGIANPSAAMLSAAMLLEFLGYDGDAAAVRDAVESVLETGPHTPDLGGDATTADVTSAVVDRLG